MRILKGLGSRVLTCGCVAGIYETYDGETIAILDVPATACADLAHEQGKQLPMDALPVRNTSSDQQ
ncbi:hypothetical protein BH23ACI1_BH23ACI1_32080 [soil metagenome]|nr:hypothetical protein [Acidobacteriota bacterium]